MNDPIRHLAGISATPVTTDRLRTLVLSAGPHDGEAVLFLHGNLSSSTFWEETMLSLPPQFRAVASDQRGYGSSDSDALIDATRGVMDWVDDAASLADHFRWPQFHLVAHSLGGCVAWAMLGAIPDRLRSVTLVAPGPPCGFGGARGPQGELNYTDGAGSGAGLVHPDFIVRLDQHDRHHEEEIFSPRAVMRRLYWKPPFVPAREEELLTAMLQVHTGPRQFPGDVISSPNWPGFAPGRFGPINAISPRYNQFVLPGLIAAPVKPRLLWVYGQDDAIVSDCSPSDAGCQGQLGLRAGWPGVQQFPPQPILTQVKFALDEYQRAGGSAALLLMKNVGHTPYLESAEEFQAALHEHLLSALP